MSHWETISGLQVQDRAGCYILLDKDGPVYVGSTANMRKRFEAHGWSYGYGGSLFTQWGQIERPRIKVRYSTRLGDWLMWEYRLIKRLKPRCNKRGLEKLSSCGSL